jgi:hypothetical protein
MVNETNGLNYHKFNKLMKYTSIFNKIALQLYHLSQNNI